MEAAARRLAALAPAGPPPCAARTSPTRLASPPRSVAPLCAAAAPHARPRRLPVLMFDVMDVCCVDPFFKTMPAFFGMSFKELLAAKHPTAWLQFERGALDEAAFFATFFADGRAVDGPGLRAAMSSAYTFVPGMEELLARLHAAGYELHAFSNYPDWWRLVEQRLTLSRFMTWTAVSCMPAMRGARKPEPEAFAAAAEAAGGAAAELVLIDDREVNVAGARAAGWAAVHFTGSAQQLEASLAAMGVSC